MSTSTGRELLHRRRLFRESLVENRNDGEASRELSLKPRVTTRPHPRFLEKVVVISCGKGKTQKMGCVESLRRFRNSACAKRSCKRHLAAQRGTLPEGKDAPLKYIVKNKPIHSKLGQFFNVGPGAKRYFFVIPGSPKFQHLQINISCPDLLYSSIRK